MSVIIKKQQYERIGILSLDEVFTHIEQNLPYPIKSGKVKIKNFTVNVRSLRLRTFYHTGINCPCCENIASFFAVERNFGNDKIGYHLNMYGIDKDNNEVLFTHDHILARSLGGLDNETNTETMCGPCNWNKGKLEAKLRQNELCSEDKKLTENELEYVKSELNRYKHGKKSNKVTI